MSLSTGYSTNFGRLVPRNHAGLDKLSIRIIMVIIADSVGGTWKTNERGDGMMLWGGVSTELFHETLSLSPSLSLVSDILFYSLFSLNIILFILYVLSSLIILFYSVFSFFSIILFSIFRFLYYSILYSILYFFFSLIVYSVLYFFFSIIRCYSLFSLFSIIIFYFLYILSSLLFMLFYSISSIFSLLYKSILFSIILFYFLYVISHSLSLSRCFSFFILSCKLSLVRNRNSSDGICKFWQAQSCKRCPISVLPDIIASHMLRGWICVSSASNEFQFAFILRLFKCFPFTYVAYLHSCRLIDSDRHLPKTVQTKRGQFNMAPTQRELSIHNHRQDCFAWTWKSGSPANVSIQGGRILCCFSIKHCVNWSNHDLQISVGLRATIVSKHWNCLIAVSGRTLLVTL